MKKIAILCIVFDKEQKALTHSLSPYVVKHKLHFTNILIIKTESGVFLNLSYSLLMMQEFSVEK